MADRPEDRLTEAKMDPDNLYLEEIFTDRRVGTIRRLTPVNGKGAIDSSRAVSYVGETQVMTSVGALPISFEIEAKDLADAAAKFGAEAKDAIERTVRDLQEMRRQAASSRAGSADTDYRGLSAQGAACPGGATS